MAGLIRGSKLQEWDTYLFYWFNKWSKDPVKHASVWISKTGDGQVYLLIGLLLWILGGVAGTQFFVTTLTAFAIELPLYLFLKNAVKRHRPFNKLVAFRSHILPSDKFSMPSGHTAAAFVFATVVMSLFPEFIGLVFAWACLIGVSRVFLGVHYPGDIVAGGVLGYSSAELAIMLVSGF